MASGSQATGSTESTGVASATARHTVPSQSGFDWDAVRAIPEVEALSGLFARAGEHPFPHMPIVSARTGCAKDGDCNAFRALSVTTYSVRAE